MSGHGEIDGLEVPKNNAGEQLSSTVDLYIGIFFDGTNNNKYQVMLGKMFRRKEIFEKAKERLKEKLNNHLFLRDFNRFDDRHTPTEVQDVFNLPNLSKRESWETNGSNGGVFSEGELNFIYGRNRKTIRSVNDVLRLSRDEIETNYSGVFTKSELEYLYFGYGNINDASDNSFDTFVEKKSYFALGGEDPNHLSAKPDDAEERGTLHRTAGNSALLQDTTDEDDAKRLEDYEGASAQGTTYTNVAILESLYKCEDKTIGERTERHISLYIEGSGTDMQLDAAPNQSHKLLLGLPGLGLGTGPSGVAGKVRKASIMIQRLLDQYIVDDVKEINFYFDLFGFSRGSTCARVMAYVINPENSEDASITKSKNKSDYKLFTSRASEFLPSNYSGKTLKKEIRFMGLFDTVSSIGVKDEDSFAEILARILDKAVGKVKDPDKKDTDTIWKCIQPYINPSLQALGFLADLQLNTQVLDKMGEMLGYNLPYISVKTSYIIEKYKEYVRNLLFKKDKGTEDLAVIPEGKGKDSLYHRNNVRDYGLWATKLAKNVIHVCALDEVRQNFALVDIESSIDDNGTEIFIPGCHTDIGGGASIGMDDVKVLIKGHNKYLSSYKIHNKAELVNKGRVSVETLKEIGWLNEDSLPREKSNVEEQTYYVEENDYIKLFRFVKPGYSNVSLNYIHSKAKDYFNPIPKSYDVPSDLMNLLVQMQEKCTGKKRYFLYPDGKEQYRELRRKYLHFSFNEQSLLANLPSSIPDNHVVNGPEFTEYNSFEKVISRIIYPGKTEGCQVKHMFDYEDGGGSSITSEPSQPQSGLHPLLSGDSTGFQEYDSSNDRIFINFPDFERVK